MKDAVKLKVAFQSCLSLAYSIRTNIASCPEWDWANTEKTKKGLDDALAPLTNLKGFSASFVAQETKVIKKKMCADKLGQGVIEFCGLRDKVEALEKKLSQLQDMHSAASS